MPSAPANPIYLRGACAGHLALEARDEPAA
jgi:hypothetical protein